MKGSPVPASDLVRLCSRALDDKKAIDLRVLDVSEQSSITDFLIVASATSEPHLRALRVELEKVIDASHTRIVGMETAQESGWLVVDAFDVMIHLFLPEVRERYRLENLWKDAREVPLASVLQEPAATKPKPKARRSAGAKPAKAKPAKKRAAAARKPSAAGAAPRKRKPSA